jgi:hypothetical protein
VIFRGSHTRRPARHVTGPGLEEVVVIALAAGRIARAVSIDEISAPLRDRLDRPSPGATGAAARVRGRVADLVHCPVCTGWWSSLLLSLVWPGNHRLRRGLSVAGAQVMLTLAERLVSEQGRVAIRQADDDQPPTVRVRAVDD